MSTAPLERGARVRRRQCIVSFVASDCNCNQIASVVERQECAGGRSASCHERRCEACNASHVSVANVCTGNVYILVITKL